MPATASGGGILVSLSGRAGVSTSSRCGVQIAELFQVDERTVRRRWQSACLNLSRLVGAMIAVRRGYLSGRSIRPVGRNRMRRGQGGPHRLTPPLVMTDSLPSFPLGTLFLFSWRADTKNQISSRGATISGQSWWASRSLVRCRRIRGRQFQVDAANRNTRPTRSRHRCRAWVISRPCLSSALSEVS